MGKNSLFGETTIGTMHLKNCPVRSATGEAMADGISCPFREG